METPNYILKATEAIWWSKHDSNIWKVVRILTYGIVLIIIVASLLFQENIFMEFSWNVKMLLIGLLITVILTNGSIRIPSEFELQFFDDYLILYRKRFPYSKAFSRKEIEKIYYADVKACRYREKSRRINFIGIKEGIYWDYKKDGTLSETPSYHKITDSMFYFYTALSDVDFVKEIEEHSPLKVEIRNS